MRDANMIVRDRQRGIRREMDRRGISLKAVAYDSDMSVSTVTSYFHNEQRDPASLSVPSLYKLIEGNALPLDLLSMLLPDGYQIVRAPEDLDHEALCKIATDYTTAKMAAHHPDSEAGREIGPGEDATLTAIVTELRIAA